MADNFFGIEEDFSDAHKANDLLFADTPPEELEEIKKKEKEEEEKRKAEELKKKQAAPPPKKTDTDPPKPIDDVNTNLFGDADDTETSTDKEEEKKDDDSDEDDSDEEKSQFELLSEELYKIGVFAADVDPDSGEETVHTAKTPEEFKKLFEYQKQMSMYAAIDSHLSRFGQDRLELFEAIFNKGVDPKDYLPVYNELQDFEALSLDTEANQERIVREYYKRSGLSDDKIDTKIKRLRDISELQSEATDLKDTLVAQDKKTLQDQEAKKTAELESEKNKDAQYKNSLVKILTEKIKTKDFDGIPVTEQAAQKVFDGLYNKKWQGKDGKKFTDFDKFILELNNPENHANKIKLGLLWEMGLDLSKIQKKAVSKESSELFKEFTQKKTKQATKKETPAAWNL